MADLVCALPQRLVYLATTKTPPTEALCRKTKANVKCWIAGFLTLIQVCLSRTLTVLWNRAAVLLAYLSLGFSLGVVVEEEGEGWTIASTAPSVLGSSPRRDGPSPPPPSHSPSPSTQRAAAPLSPSNHFATRRHPFFPTSHRCFWTQPRAIIFYSRRPTMSDLQPKFAPRIFDQFH